MDHRTRTCDFAKDFSGSKNTIRSKGTMVIRSRRGAPVYSCSPNWCSILSCSLYFFIIYPARDENPTNSRFSHDSAIEPGPPRVPYSCSHFPKTVAYFLRCRSWHRRQSLATRAGGQPRKPRSQRGDIRETTQRSPPANTIQAVGTGGLRHHSNAKWLRQ